MRITRFPKPYIGLVGGINTASEPPKPQSVPTLVMTANDPYMPAVLNLLRRCLPTALERRDIAKLHRDAAVYQSENNIHAGFRNTKTGDMDNH